MIKLRIVALTTCFLSIFTSVANAEYIFAAPPRESLEKGINVYKPIADYLSQVTGERFEYFHPETWVEYSSMMHDEKFDLVFDGPHFVDWRIHNINHKAVVKLPQLFRWQIIARKDDVSVNDIKDMVGKKACAPGSPNFGMLSMFSHFPNPDKQPEHVKIKGWINVYEAVKSGKCDAGVLPKTNLSIYDPEHKSTKIIHTHLPYPNQGFTSGPRISPALHEKIKTALLSDEGQQAMMNLRKRFAAEVKLVGADNDEYDGVRIVLKRAEDFKYKKESDLASN